MTVGDPVLEGMANELCTALIMRGLDPKHPPHESNPPTETFFAEYKKRGGTVYTDPDEAAHDLIELVKTMGS